MKVDAFASERHYAEHLAPIFMALHPSERGTFYGARQALGEIAARTDAVPQLARPGRGDRPVLVASYKDLKAARTRPIILVEHGAGQDYAGDRNPSNPGGGGREGVILFICPNESVARRNGEWYQAPAVVVGCPKMDRWHRMVDAGATIDEHRRAGTGARRAHIPEVAGSNPAGATERPGAWGTRVRAPSTEAEIAAVQGGYKDPGTGLYATRASGAQASGQVGGSGFAPSSEGRKRAVVAVSFHWDNHQRSEARWALPHFRRGLAPLTRHFEVLGHGHPRAFRHLEPTYLEAGIEPVKSFDEVLERAEVYACDNSSTIPEFASIGRPVVFLNAPWYRRDVAYGGRFWEWPGAQVQCDDPADFIGAVFTALKDPRSARDSRARMVESVYAFTDGRAAERAATAIRSVLDDSTTDKIELDPFTARPR